MIGFQIAPEAFCNNEATRRLRIFKLRWAVPHMRAFALLKFALYLTTSNVVRNISELQLDHNTSTAGTSCNDRRSTMARARHSEPLL